MTEKISASELREKTPGELNQLITELKKEKVKAITPETGSAPDPQPSESIKTIRQNIARAKTVLNEKLDGRK